MNWLGLKISELYKDGKTIDYIRNRFAVKRVDTKYVIEALIEADTHACYNHKTNRYDSIIIPSIINYNVRLYESKTVQNGKKKQSRQMVNR